MLAAIHIIENYSWYKNLPNSNCLDVRYYLGRTTFVFISAILAIIIPKFGLFLDFIGSFAGASLCIIIPVMMYEKVFRGTIGIPQLVLNKILLVIGIVFGGISTISSFYALIVEICK